MRQSTVLLVSALLTIVFMPSGCSFRAEAHDHHHHQAPSRSTTTPAMVQCVHSRTCGHCFDEERRVWITISVSHVHGPGCGHDFNGNHWIVAKGARPAPKTGPQPSPRAGLRTAHSHSPSCGCVYDGGRWIALEGHVHGEGCGHIFVNGRWMIRK